MKGRKIYIAGKITGRPDYLFHFNGAEAYLKERGALVLNPCILPPGFHYEDYMHWCFALIDRADSVCLLPCWADSPGAIREKAYAEAKGKEILFMAQILKGQNQ